jgi:GNAT superfamily N-acetyltransferase
MIAERGKMGGSLVKTRMAHAHELERIAAFYQKNRYAPKIGATDVLLGAECDAGLCGAVRLCHEHGKLVLRGMRVSGGMRRHGVGTQLLKTAGLFIADRECLCLPHRYLQSFYGQIGFVCLEEQEAPGFLRERCIKYRREYGLDVIIMYRPGIA